MFKKILHVLLLSFMLTQLAHAQFFAEYKGKTWDEKNIAFNEDMNSFVGKSISFLIERRGVGNAFYRTQDGKTYHTYGGTCLVTFTVNKSEKIEAWNINTPVCKAFGKI